MSDARVHVQSAGPGIRLLEIDNAPHNALTTAMAERAVELLGELIADADARVLVIVGANGVFCAGADLGEMRAGLDPTAAFGTFLEALEGFPLPTIAAIEGPAAGGGVEIAITCDIRVVSGAASFTCSPVNVGLFAGWHRLPRLIGLSRATEMLLTGRRYAAAEVEAWGLARRVGEARAEALDLAARIASRAPLSVRALTHALRTTFDVDAVTAARYQQETFERLRASADHAEAVAAFLEKRPPTFHGR